jgi:16S rRNA U516 pseudouridylate synthase RsuA-like enzyme
VGRLDYSSEGLLLLTMMATLRISSPQRESCPKTYLAKVKGVPHPTLKQLTSGISVDGKRLHLQNFNTQDVDNPWLSITLIEEK